MRPILLALAAPLLLSTAASAQDSRDAAPFSPPASSVAALAPIGPRTSPFAPPTQTDTTFIIDGAPGLDTGCTFRNGSPLRFTISIDRVVGDVNGDGTLVDPAGLVSSGVVSARAELRLPAFDIDYDAVVPPYAPERDRILLNGRDIGPAGAVAFLTGSDGQWKLNEFFVPTELLRFGKRNPGGAPTPGENEIEIQIDTANTELIWCMQVDWAELTFDALAPVIMVHGNNSNGRFFEDFNFIQPFEQQKIPFDNSITMATDSIAAHGTLLASLIPQKTAEFGARHAHVIAHSKGGLDTRDFLARTLPPNFGVLSLTTLSTPHHGSVGADYSIDSVNANSLFSDNTTRTKMAQQVPPDAGTFNLRVSFVAGFNASNLPALPRSLTVDGVAKPVTYMSVSADANLDGSRNSSGEPTIQINETQGTGQGGTPNIIWEGVMTQVYRLLGSVASTTLATRSVLGRQVLVVRETPTTSFQLNDFLVTHNSARVAPFREIASVLANHATMARPDVGTTTLNAIRAAQPLR